MAPLQTTTGTHLSTSTVQTLQGQMEAGKCYLITYKDDSTHFTNSIHNLLIKVTGFSIISGEHFKMEYKGIRYTKLERRWKLVNEYRPMTMPHVIMMSDMWETVTEIPEARYERVITMVQNLKEQTADRVDIKQMPWQQAAGGFSYSMTVSTTRPTGSDNARKILDITHQTIRRLLNLDENMRPVNKL